MSAPEESWTVVSERGRCSRTWTVVAGSVSIARVHEGEPKRAAKNATLIAGAPALLSAAALALTFAEQMDDEFGVGGPEADALRAAILKATAPALSQETDQ